MTTTTHTAGRWTQCPACMEKDRMLDAAALLLRANTHDCQEQLRILNDMADASRKE